MILKFNKQLNSVKYCIKNVFIYFSFECEQMFVIGFKNDEILT